MENLLHLYRFVRNNRKERFDVILEPFQAILQLSLLSFLPIGTKLMIHNNILYPQPPQWHQAILRLYNNDNKEDLYFLFHVLIRFTKFYDFLQKSEDPQLRSLYFRMIKLSKKGIDNLILTYQSSNDYALINILQLYRAIMENPNDFRNVENVSKQPHSTPSSHKSFNTNSYPASHSASSQPFTSEKEPLLSKSTKSTFDIHEDHHDYDLYDSNETNCTNDTYDTDKINEQPNSPTSSSNNTFLHNSPDSQSMKEIDKIFVTIKHLYTTHDYHLIHNILLMLESCDSVTETTKIINGLSIILEVKYQRIHKWISDNIIY